MTQEVGLQQNIVFCHRQQTQETTVKEAKFQEELEKLKDLSEEA